MGVVAKIPIIDISGGGEQLEVARELVDAAVEHGFIYIKNTGEDFPVEVIQNAFNMSKKLFGAPVEDKARCKIQQNNRGWAGMQVETLDPKAQRVGDFKEAFNFGEFKDGKAQQPIPETIEHLQDQSATFWEFCYKLCLKINYLLGVGLDVNPHDFFKDAHLREKGSSGNTLRFLYYPPLSKTDARVEDVRAGAHSDYGSITLLFRLKGQAGLEINTQQGDWAPVPVSPPGTDNDPAPPILVNIGDLLSYWTNGLLRSTVHRVVFPVPGTDMVKGETDSEDRYSIAFFCHPVDTMPLTAVPSDRVKKIAKSSDVTPDSKVITAAEHLQMRLRSTYLQLYECKDKDEE